MSPSPVRVGALALLALGACTSERTRPGSPLCETAWVEDVEVVLAEHCTACHGGAEPAGSYDLSSYAGVLGSGSDSMSNAIAGDAGSLLVTTIDPAIADATHQPFAGLADTLRVWVADCQLAYREQSVHGGGILDPRSDEFHGQVLRGVRYDFGLCADCHGEDLGGGTAETSCLSCHTEGPTDCSTCHGSLTASGPHAVHVAGGSLGESFECTQCHAVPDRYDAPGHILTASGALDEAPAEVVFGTLAAATPAGRTRQAPPSYDPETRTCADVYCHGAVLDGIGTAEIAPRWTGDADGEESCGSCHLLPPTTHAPGDDRCEVCHSQVIDAAGALVAANHIDGALQIGRAGRSGCSACHGGPDNAAPPTDLAGRTDPSLVTVGLHQLHVRSQGLRGPIPCADCHLEPDDTFAAGHIDTSGAAEVFPSGFGGLAGAGGASPTWDRDQATCSDVYCHGGGALADDPSPSVVRTVSWTGAGPAMFCGSCHGVPPDDYPVHEADWTLTECHICHSSVNSAGIPILTGPPGQQTSEHIDGDVDFH